MRRVRETSLLVPIPDAVDVAVCAAVAWTPTCTGRGTARAAGAAAVARPAIVAAQWGALLEVKLCLLLGDGRPSIPGEGRRVRSWADGGGEGWGGTKKDQCAAFYLEEGRRKWRERTHKR